MKRVSGALAELSSVLAGVDEAGVDAACQLICDAGKIVLYGCGREALQVRGFAMRLHHLGLDVAMQGDMTTPPIGEGDLLIVSAGPGELATVTALMQVARGAGADVLFLTGEMQTEPAKMATQVLEIPAQTTARDTGPDVQSILPMGSLYEGAMFVLFEIMVLKLRDRLGATADEMRMRHTNLE